MDRFGVTGRVAGRGELGPLRRRQSKNAYRKSTYQSALVELSIVVSRIQYRSFGVTLVDIRLLFG